MIAKSFIYFFFKNPYVGHSGKISKRNVCHLQKFLKEMFCHSDYQQNPYVFRGLVEGVFLSRKTYFFWFLMVHLSDQSIIDGWIDVNSDIGII